MINYSFTVLLSIFGSFVLVTLLIPKISWIITNRNLIHNPNLRSSHLSSIPAMAGISFFLALLFILVVMQEWDTDAISINLIASVGLIFAIGLKDDLVISTPRAKIGGEIMAICILLFCKCLEVNSLNGFLGVYGISTTVSYGIVILMILIIINSYNLIDGIDGLAATIGIVVFSVYAYLFYVTDLIFYFLLCLSFIGMLLAYLRYNLSETEKVFMGDTGSLIMGFFIGFVSLKFLTIDPVLIENNGFKPANNFIVIIAVLIIPLFDTLRIVLIRLFNKKGLFKADNNHIHHVLIGLGLTHFKASLCLGFLNLLFTAGIIYLSTIFESFFMMMIIVLCFVVLLSVFYFLKTKVILK
jgi:UDP-GlcNAc:undecaprenyl-phosphate/decaprenyl-phosphate GlcNAc-1-phosphate transferase